MSGQPAPRKLQLSTLVRLITAGRIRTADELRDELLEAEQAEQAEHDSVDSGELGDLDGFQWIDSCSDSDSAPLQARLRESVGKRRAEGSLQSRGSEERKKYRGEAGDIAAAQEDREEESKDDSAGHGMDADDAAQVTSAPASRVEEHIEHEDMNVEEGERDAELTTGAAAPPVLPRIDTQLLRKAVVRSWIRHWLCDVAQLSLPHPRCRPAPTFRRPGPHFLRLSRPAR